MVRNAPMGKTRKKPGTTRLCRHHPIHVSFFTKLGKLGGEKSLYAPLAEYADIG